MKHNYKKPEIIIHKFETSDVISTSCTCPAGTHYHYLEGCYLVDRTYVHAENYAIYGTFNNLEPTGYCDEHKAYWVYQEH